MTLAIHSYSIRRQTDSRTQYTFRRLVIELKSNVQELSLHYEKESAYLWMGVVLASLLFP